MILEYRSVVVHENYVDARLDSPVLECVIKYDYVRLREILEYAPAAFL